ncbi:MAG: hypothetical protein IJN92_10570 [Lachnospiraceae bacterium]|nr:hypothetical protein [Lachnospiraceae bacterium]
MSQMALTLLIGALVIALLPSSPFNVFINALQSIPYLDWLNWFVPISTFISIGEAWLVCITTFYLASILLRYIKAIS